MATRTQLHYWANVARSRAARHRKQHEKDQEEMKRTQARAADEAEKLRLEIVLLREELRNLKAVSVYVDPDAAG